MNWNDLDISSKAELMKLYVANGITSLDDIKNHYNSFATGGQMNTDGSKEDESIVSNPQTKAPEQQNWLNNWYAGRTTQLNNHFNNFNQRVQETSRNPDSFKTDINRTPLSYITNAINEVVNLPIKTDWLGTIIGRTGVYKPYEDTIGLAPLIGNNSTLLHERVHALNNHLPNTYEGVNEPGNYNMISLSPIELDSYRRNEDVYKNQLKNDGEIFYYENPKEIYSRLMQFRYENNVDPTHKWTLEEIKDLRSKGFLGIGNPLIKHNLSAYDDNFLLYLFNEVAQNNSSSQDTTHYAALGGHLSKDDGTLGKITSYGQWQYPHQITTIPSNNITMQGVNYPVIGVSNTGDEKLMLPNLNYHFNGDYVTEYPINNYQKEVL